MYHLLIDVIMCTKQVSVQYPEKLLIVASCLLSFLLMFSGGVIPRFNNLIGLVFERIKFSLGLSIAPNILK
ncbi:hypothetical protein AX774_g4018 [Zancudomyces culisetae]|uniref:Uncharacterized protein n=1 Tax=Zancudomyces culisetae TaxID=1213189 RepID=A0A1R1PNI4_ZANCU|nr:hypothetical protein AX774_g4018 [Zancudomyces culisetae]|eukprot:OMH82491.1 hypothetical protein AX774_g4018 [Zancudomyces culisetae]